MLAERAPCEAEVYNLGSGIETKIKELADLVLEQLSENIPVEFDGHQAVGNPINWRSDVSRIAKIGFTPEVTLERGVKVYVQWCRAEILGW
jgi:UDP-glucose 4-epimerase